MSRKTLTLALAAALVASAGCAIDLPDPRLIIDTRVLAIKTTVTTPLPGVDDPDAQTPRAQALPFEVVEIEPFLVGPDGPIGPDAVDPVWIACDLGPSEGLFACLEGALPTTLDDIPQCPVPSFEDLMGEELPEPPSPCLIGRTGIPEYTVPFSSNLFVGGSVELTMIAGPVGGTSTDTCAEQLLADEYELPDDCLFAVQRLSLGPIEQLLALAAQFGVEIEGFEIPEPETIPDGDRHVRISQVAYSVLGEDGEPIGDPVPIETGDQVPITIGETMRIDVSTPEEDLQSYQIPVNNGESFDTREETIGGDWFLTWGQLLAGTNDDPDSYNEWIFEQGEQDELEMPEDS